MRTNNPPPAQSFYEPDLDRELQGIWVMDFTENTATRFHERVLSEHEADPFKPIVINISSYGGEVDALLSMLDTMDIVRAMAPEEFKFFTVAYGKAMSAGATLLSYGDYRFATPNTRIMLHQVVSGTWGSQPANEVEFSEISRLNRELLKILKKRCKITSSLKDFKTLLSHNLFLTPKKAKDLGLIDFIGYPKVVTRTVHETLIYHGENPAKEEVSK